jgi:two-component system invasion response regulator UvrY
LNILLIDDHAIVRDGLRRLFATLAPTEIFEAANGRDGIALARRRSLDLIVLDLNLPDLGGLELLSRLLHIRQTPILIFSMHAEPLYVRRALDAGARGYVSKNAAPDELLTAVRKGVGGGRYVENELAQALVLQDEVTSHSLEQLSSRDIEILRLLVQGRSLGEIADALGLSYKTVANLCTQIKSRLGAARNADLVRLAIEAGIS